MIPKTELQLAIDEKQAAVKKSNLENLGSAVIQCREVIIDATNVITESAKLISQIERLAEYDVHNSEQVAKLYRASRQLYHGDGGSDDPKRRPRQRF